MEDTRSVAGWIGSQELLLGRVQTVDEVVEQIEAVEYDQLMAVAKRILSPDQATMAIVGPFSDETEFTRALGV